MEFKHNVEALLRALPNSTWMNLHFLKFKGFPDWVGCIRGQYVALHLVNQDPFEYQLHDKIVKAGGLSFQVYPEEWENIYRLLIRMSSGEVITNGCKKPLLKNLDS